MAKLITQKGDLFAVPANDGIIRVHCVGNDFLLGAGIARQFAARGVREALVRNYRNGDSLGRCLFTDTGFVTANLVSKPWSAYYPGTRSRCRGNLKVLAECLADLERNLPRGTRELHMPKIGCGLDGLNWADVSRAIADAFKDDDIVIRVFEL